MKTKENNICSDKIFTVKMLQSVAENIKDVSLKEKVLKFKDRIERPQMKKA